MLGTLRFAQPTNFYAFRLAWFGTNQCSNASFTRQSSPCRLALTLLA
jgi:hypothetical protein